MTASPTSVNVKAFSEGMSKLKTAAFLHIISSILIYSATFAWVWAVFATMGATVVIQPGEETPSGPFGHLAFTHMGIAMGTVVALIIAGIAGFVMALVATYGFLLPASAKFAEYDKERYGTVSTLIKIGFIGGPLSAIGGIVLAVLGIFVALPGFVVVGVILLIIAIVLLLIGIIGLIIMTFRLKDDTDDDLFMIAGILFIIGLFVGFLTVIAWILVYVAAKPGAKPTRSAHKGSDILPPPPPI